VSDLAIAAILTAAILVASTISVEIGLSVALVELTLGVVVGNAFSLSVPDWLSFVGSFAGIVLTFLAGAESTYRSSSASGPAASSSAVFHSLRPSSSLVPLPIGCLAGSGTQPRSPASRSRRRVLRSSMRCSWKRASTSR
jgi:Kef-type K+ transport system membrane component KefB